MSQFWSSTVASLQPYVPGEQPKVADLIKLNTNENPYPPSPRVLTAIVSELAHDAERLRLYPDPTAERFKEAVIRHLASAKLSGAQVFAGNGSDEVLALVFQALLKHEAPILLPDISYSFYPTYCRLYAIDYRPVPLAADFSIHIDDYNMPNGGIILANPNAPTGLALPLSDIERLVASHRQSVVVIDEAYVDFGAHSAVNLIADYPNLLVVRTLSKSHALAGLRIGYALGHADLISGLERVKNSFNSYPLDRLAIVGGSAALEDTDYLEKTRHAVIKSRDALSAGLGKLGFRVLPSCANFIFATHPQHDAAELALALRAQKIIVRHFKAPRIEQFLRISIGTDQECQALLAALAAITQE